MDPDECLRRIREALQIVQHARNDRDVASSASEALECIEALDEWLSKGGFLPSAWQR